DDLQIQFGIEEFCLVTGLRFGIDYSDDYKQEGPIPFRRRVFESAKDDCLIRLEDRCEVSDWILRLANDRGDWDMYPWGSYIWPILYSQLRDANIKRWQPLYTTQQQEDDEHKSYLLFGFTWAFKGHLSTRRLTPDEFEAGSDWWVSSRAYFDGHTSEAARIPYHVKRQNEDVPLEFYREFEERKRVMNELMKKEVARGKMYTQMHKFMEDMQVGPMRQAKKGPIIVDQHYGLRFPQGGPSSFPTQRSTSFFEVNLNILNRERREACPSTYRRIQYMDLPRTMVLPKKRGDKTKNKGKNANVSPLNLGNAFVDDNIGADDVLIMGEHETDNYFVYENVDPSKIIVVLRLYMAGFHSLEQCLWTK
nr:phospholipase-like protein [Tanacetum cinerariifolium]